MLEAAADPPPLPAINRFGLDSHPGPSTVHSHATKNGPGGSRCGSFRVPGDKRKEPGGHTSSSGCTEPPHPGILLGSNFGQFIVYSQTDNSVVYLLDAQIPDDQKDNDDDAGSTRGSLNSSTASVSTSIWEYRKILGRTYHGDVGNAEAWTPNDDKHAEALDLYHHVHYLLYDGKLFLAPLIKDIRVCHLFFRAA